MKCSEVGRAVQKGENELMAEGANEDAGRDAGGGAAELDHGVAQTVLRPMIRRDERRVIASTGPGKVVPGVWATDEIPRPNDFEDAGGRARGGLAPGCGPGRW